VTGDAARDDGTAATHVVVVASNLVVAIARVDGGAAIPVAQTRLEIATQLADNYRNNGCIDGRYHFANAQRARVFATLCLEFTQAQIERRLAAIRSLAAGEEFDAGSAPARPTTLKP